MIRNISILVFLLCFIQQKPFDADGYYSPKSTLTIGGRQLNWININTVDYFVNGKLDYDNPKSIPPEILLSFLKSPKPFSASDIVVNHDSLCFRVKLSKGNVVEFRGKFLDPRGQYWDRTDIKSNVTVVLTGETKYFVNGSLKEHKQAEYTYWEGD